MKTLIVILTLAGLFPTYAVSQTSAKGASPQSPLKVDTTQSSCGELLSSGYAAASARREPDGYDTLRAFMEDCPQYQDAWREFSDINGAASQCVGMGLDTWSNYLTWLKKVLYLNLDTNWYCGDVGNMITAEQTDHAAVMSICQYIIQSGKCPEFAGVFAQINHSAAEGRYLNWLDSLYRLYPPSKPFSSDSIRADTLAHPYSDTIVPALQQENLQILMGPQFAGVQSSQPMTSVALLNAQLLTNPMKNEIDISYQIGRAALVTMQLSDLLGRTVPLSYAKYQLEQPGQHYANIPASNLPPGTYYLRITTDTGDAMTLKVVKE